MDVDGVADGGRDTYILARLVTRTPRYAVPDTTYSLQEKTNIDDLNQLLNSLLKESLEGDQAWTDLEFDYLINGEILTTSLDKFIQAHSISAEDVITIEYIERLPAPEPDRSIPHADWVSSVQSSSNLILTGSYDKTLRIFSSSGQELVSIEAHTAPIKAVSWIEASQTGLCTFLTSSHDQTAVLWQWDSSAPKTAPEPKGIYRGHAGSVDAVSASPDKRKFCSVSWDKMLKLWSLEDDGQENENSIDEPAEKKAKTDKKKLTRVPIATLSGHREAVTSCVWTDSNEIMTASLDRSIRIWDVELGGITKELEGQKALNCIAYSPLSRLLISGGADRVVRLYDPRSNEGTIVKANFVSHNGWISSVCWSPLQEHYFISGSYDKVMKMWDCRNPKAALYDLAGHTDKILCVNWTHSNLLLSGGADNELKIFRAST